MMFIIYGAGTHSFVAWLGHLTIDHAFLPRWSTVSTRHRDTSLITFPPRIFARNVSHMSPPLALSLLMVTISLLAKRSFPLHLMYQTFSSHVSGEAVRGRGAFSNPALVLFRKFVP